FADSEAPTQPEPDLLYSLGVEPLTLRDEHGLSVRFRYPQREYGHRGDGGPDAYIAKSTFDEGEMAFKTWKAGDSVEKTLYLWLSLDGSRQAYDQLARFLCAAAYTRTEARSRSSLW